MNPKKYKQTSRKQNEEFRKVQAEYLSHPFGSRPPQLLARLYTIAYAYCLNAVNLYVEVHGLAWTGEESRQKAHDMAVYTVQGYLYRPGFAVQKLSSYAYWAKKKILFDEKQMEWERRTVHPDDYEESAPDANCGDKDGDGDPDDEDEDECW